MLSTFFTASSVIVLQKGGDGSANTVAQRLVLIERTVAANALRTVRTLVLPFVAAGVQAACTGTATYQLDLQRSADGRFLVLPCFGAAKGTASAAALLSARVVARVAADGSVDTSTALTDVSTTMPMISVASRDGSAYYLSIEGAGIRYAIHGATTSTAIVSPAVFLTANRVGLWFGELWASGHSSNVQTARGFCRIGAGAAPTALATTVTSLPGYMTATQQAQAMVCYGFEFISPYALGGSCDTSADGYDYYRFDRTRSGTGWPASPADERGAGWPLPLMKTRWNGGLIYYGTFRCDEPAQIGAGG
jgi:hypothetical protein